MKNFNNLTKNEKKLFLSSKKRVSKRLVITNHLYKKLEIKKYSLEELDIFLKDSADEIIKKLLSLKLMVNIFGILTAKYNDQK